MEFQDKSLNCVDCGDPFIWTAGEQLFFADKNFKNEPKRCKSCKAKRAARPSGAGGVGRERVETTTNHEDLHGRPNSFICMELRELILNWKPCIPVIAYCIPTDPKGPYRATWSHRATADPPAGGGV